jgi:hypothetical protein
MLRIVKYESTDRFQWNSFLDNCKNKHFMFHRDYMEYHADRFHDFSLMVFDEKEKLIALFPANLAADTVHSHQGLTFGGFLIDERLRTETMVEIFATTRDFLKKAGVIKLVYKCIPYIYHTSPADEDKYALFLNEARLFRRDVSSAVLLAHGTKYSKGRKWSINKAKKEGVVVESLADVDEYWDLLEGVLRSQHNAAPVHSREEIGFLREKFPGNIKIYVARLAGKVLAGTVVYEIETIVHTQYLANSELGREIGALDLVIDNLLTVVYANKRFFDFGVSNENSGRSLNAGLIAQKEGFGARAVVHDFYELNI